MEPLRSSDSIAVTFAPGLLFDYDSAVLRPDAQANLDELAQSLDEYDNSNVLVVGHTGRMQDLSMTVEKIAAFSRLRLDVMAVEETLETAREEIEDLRLSIR